jgi:hypothetical protein
MKVVPNQKFKEFQDKYGAIPASDKNNHLTKSRMLQGIYRNQKLENAYCNYVFGDNGFVNFMRNEKLQADAKNELVAIKQRERLTDEKRLFENLLSSQPLAFNIFLPLKWHNFEVGNAVFKELFPFLNIKQLVDIKLEFVPGDGIGKDDRKITTDNSCFDVYVEYKNEKNELGGIGIEVKYTEPFSQSDYWKETGYRKDRYIDAIQKYFAQFSMENAKDYLQPTYNQLFRNQLLAEEAKDKFKMNCILAVVYSEEDVKCIETVTRFLDLIKLENSCVSISISQIVQSAIKASENFPKMKSLYEDIYNRYCNYNLLNRKIVLEKTTEITKPFVEKIPEVQFIITTDLSEKKVEPKKKVETKRHFIENVSMSDIPSSRNWKEVFDFSQTFNIDKYYRAKDVPERTAYLKIYFQNRRLIDSESISELRAVLFYYITEQRLDRNSCTNYEQGSFTSSIIHKINNIIYNKLWEDK